MRRFLVCIHDATPAYARETRMMIRDLAPLLGRRLSFGVVPNWYGEWPLTAHPEYCGLIQESSEELLLHGYFHRRQRGWGPITLLTESGDEMNGLDAEETRRTLERDSVSSPRCSGNRRGGSSHRPGGRGTCAWATEILLGWSTSSGFSRWSRVPAERCRWRHGPGTVAAGAGSGISARGSDGCRSLWIIASLRWRFIREIWSAVTGRTSSASHRSSSTPGTNRAHWQACLILKSLLDAVMERRARQMLEHVGGWLPGEGPVLDLGSGTGHFSARLERELGLQMVTADVSDMHVVGPPPVSIAGGVLPFEAGTFSAALLLFMLTYPNDPAGVLVEAARVTRGPIILMQSLHSGRLGYAWLRVREFVWTFVGIPRVEGRSATSVRTRSSACGRGAFIPPRRFSGTWPPPGCGSARGRSGRCCLAVRWWLPAGSSGPMSEIRLSFVIPARNEEALIGEVLDAILASVARASGLSPERPLAPGHLIRGHRRRRWQRRRHGGHRADLRR